MKAKNTRAIPTTKSVFISMSCYRFDERSEFVGRDDGKVVNTHFVDMPSRGFAEVIIQPNADVCAFALHVQANLGRYEPPEADERGIAEEELVLTYRDNRRLVIAHMHDANHDSLPFRFVLFASRVFILTDTGAEVNTSADSFDLVT